MKFNLIYLLLVVLISSCASKKEVLYFQDAEVLNQTTIEYVDPTIQPNDILKITVETLVPEAALAYNNLTDNSAQINSIELLKLNGYLVSVNNTIKFPSLGEINVDGLTTSQLSNKIREELISGGHLINPKVDVRLLNSKVTILGEVNKPGTYTFTEQNITLLQALGYASDLSIKGSREDLLVIREIDGVRNIKRINLTTSDWVNSEYYFVKPNDVVVVNPNDAKVKSAGFIGDVGSLIAVASLLLSVTILLTQ